MIVKDIPGSWPFHTVLRNHYKWDNEPLPPKFHIGSRKRVSPGRKSKGGEEPVPPTVPRHEDHKRDKPVESPYNPLTCIWINDPRRFTVELSTIDIFEFSASVYPPFTFLFISMPLKKKLKDALLKVCKCAHILMATELQHTFQGHLIICRFIISLCVYMAHACGQVWLTCPSFPCPLILSVGGIPPVHLCCPLPPQDPVPTTITRKTHRDE